VSAVLLPFPGNQVLAAALAAQLGAVLGEITLREFPDGETYVRIHTPVARRHVILVCTLDRPDGKFLPLAFTAATARQLGAAGVGLVAPYLAYMRQDKRFKDGEGITSAYFANLLSGVVDWIVTVDPHLHRYRSLSEIYAIPARVVSAAPLLSKWIQARISKPLLIGPDSESEQWVAAVAAEASAPYLVLEKIRHGDRDVQISVPDVARWHAHTPVLVDDIISTGQTLVETIAHLKRDGLPAPVCVGVHAVMTGSAHANLLAAGAAAVVTCNTIAHVSNDIDVTTRLADAVCASLPAEAADRTARKR
jgi:ribose-phosphate pyrophosphokinase